MWTYEYFASLYPLGDFQFADAEGAFDSLKEYLFEANGNVQLAIDQWRRAEEVGDPDEADKKAEEMFLRLEQGGFINKTAAGTVELSSKGFRLLSEKNVG